MQDPLRKVPFRCPECGFVQQEPETLISTYCRSCGHYYKGGADRSDKGASSLLPSLFKGKGRANRLVHCYRCDQEHQVSSSARSTMCPTCNAGIEFDDLVVSSNASRPVDTRGKLHVTKKGYLNNAHIVCGEAVIEGRINGALRCEGAVHLRCSGALSSRITAGSLVVEKHSRLEISYPVTVGELVVYGTVKGQFVCSSKVRILKGGALEGTLVTPAVTVERGGTLLADSTIQPPKHPEVDTQPSNGQGDVMADGAEN